MVVDDEYLPRQNIINILNWEKYGFEIVGECTNAMQALELLKFEEVDVVICDIVMPYIDGIELSKTIKRLYPKIEIIILSGYDNFDYVKTTFKYGVKDYILKPTLNAKQLIEILNPIRLSKGHSFEPIELGDYVEDVSMELLSLLEENKLSDDVLSGMFQHPEYSLITYGTRYTNDVDIDTLDNKALKLFENHNPVKLTLCDDARLCILNHRYDDGFDISIRWNDFKRYLDAKHSKLYAIKIHGIDNADRINNGFIKAKRMARQYFYGMDKMFRVMHLKDVPEYKNQNIDFAEFMERADSNSPAIALSYLKDFLDGLNEEAVLSVDELKATVNNCTYNIINMIQVSEDYFSEVNEYKINFLNNVSKSKNLVELKKYYSDIHNYLLQLIDNMGITDKIMEKVTEYIHENFSHQISLQMIASELYLSYSYLSTYFNKNYDVGFNDYLNQVRIKKAKEYLLDKDVQIAYVSHMVGYSSQGYFTKVFKKLVGMTPSQYRKKNIR